LIPKIFNGHDKLFFFADIEDFRSHKGQTTDITLPSAAWRSGNFQSYLTGQTYTDPCTGAVYDTGQLFDPTTTRQVTCNNGTTGFERNPISYNGQPNVINPAEISPVAKATLALVPMPNFGSNQYIWSPVNVHDYLRGDIKVDYQFGEHDHFFGRYGVMDDPSTGVPLFPGSASPGTYSVGRQQGAAAGDTHIFSPTTINEFRVGWARNNTHNDLFGTGLNASTLGYGGVPYQAGVLGGLPDLQFSDIGGFGASNWAPSIYTARNAQFSDTLNLVRGKHTFKIGGQYNRYSWLQFQSQYAMGFFDFTGALTKSLTTTNASDAAASGSGFAQFLFGIPDYSGLSNSIESDNIRWTGAVFVQDDWKVSSKLTINAGLRWEFGAPLGENQNRVSGIDFQTGAFEIPKSRQNEAPFLPPGVPVEYVNSNTLFQNSILNFGPRLGFAYRLTPKTVIRAGGGIFFANPFVAGTAGYPLNPPFGVIGYVHAPATGPVDPVTGQPVVSVTNISSGFPSTFLSNFDPATTQLYLYDTKPKYPTTNDWNFAIQHELPGSVVLEVAYAGSKSSHVIAGNDLNQPYPTADPNSPVQSRRPYPALGPFDVIETGMDAHYDSLQVKAEKRYSNGLTFLFAYTWAHAIDDVGSIGTLGAGGSGGDYYDFYRDARDISIDKGNSFFDIRNRFVLSSLYDLPIGHGHLLGNGWNGIVNQIFGGWRLGGILQFQTGFHFTAITFNDPANSSVDSFAGAAIPDVLGNPYNFSYGQAQQAAEGCPVGHQSVECYFNPAAFGYPAAGQFGNEGRNQLVGPSLFNLDLSIYKEFPIHDRAHVEFRGEFFNATNHPNFALPQNTVEASNFGALTSTTTDGRDIQFALRVVF
jgi:hypothetical protein